MTANPLSCHAGDDAYLVLEMITRHGLRGMVVLNEQGEFEGVISTLALANQLAAASKALCSALGRLYDQENTREGQLTNAAEKAYSFHVAMAEHAADRSESGSESASPRSHRHIRFPG